MMRTQKSLIQKGSIWQLGQHRLICGNAGNPSITQALFAGEQHAPLVLTDVPYAAGASTDSRRQKGSRQVMQGSHLSTDAQYRLFERVFDYADADALYIMTDWRFVDVVTRSFEQDYALRNMLVWNKMSPGLGALWRNAHEFILYASKRADRRQKGVPAASNVLNFKRLRTKDHPFQKPIALLAHILQMDSYTERGLCSVYDPFCGSGSTLLACEKVGRRCYAVDIDAIHIATTMKRWEDLTGQCAEEIGHVF